MARAAAVTAAAVNGDRVVLTVDSLSNNTTYSVQVTGVDYVVKIKVAVAPTGHTVVNPMVPHYV